MHSNCTSKVTDSQFMNDESKAGWVCRISGHHVDQPQPKGTDGHIKARGLSKCQYLCSSYQYTHTHTHTHTISVKMMLSILDDCLLTERLDIHEISWFVSIFSFTSKAVNRIQLASMKNATCNSCQADWCSLSLKVKQPHIWNTLKVRLLYVSDISIKNKQSSLNNPLHDHLFSDCIQQQTKATQVYILNTVSRDPAGPFETNTELSAIYCIENEKCTLQVFDNRTNTNDQTPFVSPFPSCDSLSDELHLANRGQAKHSWHFFIDLHELYACNPVCR